MCSAYQCNVRLQRAAGPGPCVLPSPSFKALRAPGRRHGAGSPAPIKAATWRRIFPVFCSLQSHGVIKWNFKGTEAAGRGSGGAGGCPSGNKRGGRVFGGCGGVGEGQRGGKGEGGKGGGG